MVPATRALLDERARLAGVLIPEVLADRLTAYYALLMRWNRKINLTALQDSPEAVDRLLLEPVAAAPLLPSASVLIDLGSGGGSPAIPLGLALGVEHLVMVESRSRKAVFLREAAREVGLRATVEAVRFEVLADAGTHHGTGGIVSLRAVRPDAETLRLAWSLTKPDGVVALFLSAQQDVQLPSGTAGLATPLIGDAVLHVSRRDVPRGTFG